MTQSLQVTKSERFLLAADLFLFRFPKKIPKRSHQQSPNKMSMAASSQQQAKSMLENIKFMKILKHAFA